MDCHPEPAGNSALPDSEPPAASSPNHGTGPREAVNYRIYRMREAPRQQFRSAPHVSGVTTVKRKDYFEDGSIRASSEYAVWSQMRQTGKPLQVGDILETETGELRICKYVGFEKANWWIPESKPESEVAAMDSAAQMPGQTP